MNRRVSNRRQLVLLLLLGLVLAPALGILPPLMAPRPKDAAAAKGLRTADIAFPAVLVAVGAAITVFAIRRCPDHFTFSDALTVHYLFHQRVLRPKDVVETSTTDREATVGGLHSGTVPVTFRDIAVSIHLADGSRLAWVGSKSVVSQFEFAFQRWLQEGRASEAEQRTASAPPA